MNKYLVALPLHVDIDSKQKAAGSQLWQVSIRYTFIYSPISQPWFTPSPCACKKKIDPIYEDEELWDMRNEFSESRVSKYITVIYMALNKSNFTLGKALMQ